MNLSRISVAVLLLAATCLHLSAAEATNVATKKAPATAVASGGCVVVL